MNDKNALKISLIVPCYNEEEAIPVFYKTIREYEPLKNYNVEICFISDGSNDQTEEIIFTLAEQDTLVIPLSFTRNFGKEAALICGLEHCTGDVVIPMDVDLKDPVEIIPLLLEKYLNGADVVLAKRIDRTTDSFLKRETADLYYKLHNYIGSPKIEENVGDFRLMSREVVQNVCQLKERNIFMKGLLSWVGGNRVEIVEYTRPQRTVGQTKFNGIKLIKLAMDGLTSFSTVPLKIWTILGIGIAGLAGFYGFYRIISKLIFGNPTPGYTSLIVAILFLGGVQLIGIGVLGEYISRIYTETKQRPRYILKNRKKQRR